MSTAERGTAKHAVFNHACLHKVELPHLFLSQPQIMTDGRTLINSMSHLEGSPASLANLHDVCVSLPCLSRLLVHRLDSNRHLLDQSHTPLSYDQFQLRLAIAWTTDTYSVRFGSFPPALVDLRLVHDPDVVCLSAPHRIPASLSSSFVVRLRPKSQ